MLCILQITLCHVCSLYTVIDSTFNIATLFTIPVYKYTGLVGGSVVYEGRVEIFRDNSWTTVCDDGWGSTDADVFCRQIGYPGADFSYGLAQFGEGSGTIQIRNVACTGTETDIRDCPFNTDANTACTHSEDAGVRCLRNISETAYCTAYCTYNN